MAENDSEEKFGEEHKNMGWLRLMAEFMRTFEATFGDPLPEEFWKHMRSSRKERLLAMRSLLDARIAHLEAMEEEARDRTATKITVQ